jgi:CheY-like chemotaxis protein
MPAPGPSIEPQPSGPDAARADRLAHAEAQARAALQEKLAFIDHLGAEMTAGLRGVLALTELLETQALGGDAPAYVRSLNDCGRLLLHLVADAVELSRADAGELPFALEPVHLRDLLDEVEVQWRPQATEDGVSIGVVFKGDAALAARLDPARLKQVYGLLISQALKLTRRGGIEASLEAALDGERVLLQGRVRDTGRGIDPVTAFEPFGRHGPAAQGGGLELALAKRLVDAMGGRIWAEPNDGAGCTVLFQFDAKACAAPADTEQANEPESPPLSGHVLIVDDNATNRIVAQTLVELFGCTCRTAADGIEAVEAVSHDHFDAVLMDVRMPRMDGLAATRAIRALPGRGELPIIALTANADPDDVRTYRAAGMSAVVDKPIRAERLLSALQEALDRQPLPDRAQAAA